MDFKHISEVLDYLEQATDYDNLLERIDEIPNKFGDWDVEPNEYRECRIINSWYDKTLQTWEQEITETQIPFPVFDEEDDRSELPWDYGKHFN